MRIVNRGNQPYGSRRTPTIDTGPGLFPCRDQARAPHVPLSQVYIDPGEIVRDIDDPMVRKTVTAHQWPDHLFPDCSYKRTYINAVSFAKRVHDRDNFLTELRANGVWENFGKPEIDDGNLLRYRRWIERNLSPT